MNTGFFRYLLIISLLGIIFSSMSACKKSVKQQEDELYSRHLQQRVKLTIISTPPPDNSADVNLLVCTDGELFEKLKVKFITDSLYRAKQLHPLVIVGVHPGNRLDEYGVAERSGKAVNGGKADHFESFFVNELYPYTKKMAGVRKFKSIAIVGFGAGGLSALDIAWSHADKISKAGVFSAAFSRKEKNTADTSANGMMYDKLKNSRKRPRLQYWFYAGANGNTGISKDDAKNIPEHTDAVVELLQSKSFIAAEEDIVYLKGETNDMNAWQHEFPFFLEWAFGK